MKLYVILGMCIFLTSLFVLAQSEWDDASYWTPENIAANPEQAQSWIAENGLTGPQGIAYISHLTNNRVSFKGGNENIKATGTLLRNVRGPSLDVSQYPQGTEIRPDGDTGFIVVLPGTEGQQREYTFSDPDVSSVEFITYEGSTDVSFDVTLADGRLLSINPLSDFSFRNGILQMASGSASFPIREGVFATAVAAGPTTLSFTDGKSRVEGLFQVTYTSPLGFISVPGRPEFLLASQGLLDPYAFCVGCDPDDIRSDSQAKVTYWDGQRLTVKGQMGASITNGDDVYYPAGVTEGVVFQTDGSFIDITHTPPLEDLNGRIVEHMLVAQAFAQERLQAIQSKLDQTTDASERLQLENALELAQQVVDAFPQRGSGDDLIQGYSPEDLAFYASADLVLINHLQGNSHLVSKMALHPESGDPDLAVHRVSLTGSVNSELQQLRPFDYRFDGDTEYRVHTNGQLQYDSWAGWGSLYFAGDTQLSLQENGDGSYSVNGDLNIGGIAGDLAAQFVHGTTGSSIQAEIAQSGLEAVFNIDLPLLSYGVRPDGGLDFAFRFDNEITEQLNRELPVPESAVSYIKNSFGLGTGTFIQEQITPRMRQFVLAGDEFLGSFVDPLAESGVFPRESLDDITAGIQTASEGLIGPELDSIHRFHTLSVNVIPGVQPIFEITITGETEGENPRPVIIQSSAAVDIPSYAQAHQELYQATQRANDAPSMKNLLQQYGLI